MSRAGDPLAVERPQVYKTTNTGEASALRARGREGLGGAGRGRELEPSRGPAANPRWSGGTVRSVGGRTLRSLRLRCQRSPVLPTAPTPCHAAPAFRKGVDKLLASCCVSAIITRSLETGLSRGRNAPTGSAMDHPRVAGHPRVGHVGRGAPRLRGQASEGGASIYPGRGRL